MSSYPAKLLILPCYPSQGTEPLASETGSILFILLSLESLIDSIANTTNSAWFEDVPIFSLFSRVLRSKTGGNYLDSCIGYFFLFALI